MVDASASSAIVDVSDEPTPIAVRRPGWLRLWNAVATRKIADVLSVLVVRGLGAVSLFVLYYVAAHRMTQTDAGAFFLGLTVSTVFAPIALFGLHTGALREVSARCRNQQGGEIRYVIERTLLQGCLTALIPALLLYQSAAWLAEGVFQKPEMVDVLRYAALAGYASSIGMLLASQLQGLRCFTQSLLVLSIATPMGASLLLMIPEQTSAVAATQLYAVASCITAGVGGLCLLSQCPAVRAQAVVVPRLASSCLSLWLINTMIMSVNWSVQLIAGVYLSSGDGAVLAVAQRTANLVNFILIGVNFVVTPRFSSYWAKQDVVALRNLAIQSTRAMSLVALPIMLVIGLMPNQIMSWFGREFFGSGMLLLILATGQLFNVTTGSVNALLNMCGFDRDLRNIVLVSGSLTIVLSWLLTRTYGATGCAVAMATALILQNALAVHRVRRRLGFSMLEAIVPRRFMSERRKPATEQAARS